VPVPTKRPNAQKLLAHGDFSSAEAALLWSGHGRADLSIIRALGVNTVRLYGDDPRIDGAGFFDAAYYEGLSVIIGMSDWPYIQAPNNCLTTDFDCSGQLRESYLENLQNGLTQGNAYNPALQKVIVVNEPDLKIPGIARPKAFCKAVLSALDGMLEAEKEAGLTEGLVNFTVTFSYGICSECSEYNDKPALWQMVELRKAMQSPEDYGYTPMNDLWEAYRTRWTNSYNTANPARDIRPQFLDAYLETFTETPVFIAESHKPQLIGTRYH